MNKSIYHIYELNEKMKINVLLYKILIINKKMYLTICRFNLINLIIFIERKEIILLILFKIILNGIPVAEINFKIKI